jgi:hypothetical protein
MKERTRATTGVKKKGWTLDGSEGRWFDEAMPVIARRAGDAAGAP